MAAHVDWKIVLMDDEADIREVMTLALQDAGYQVASADNGETGLALCRSFEPQIVITDIRMPKLDGLQVLATLKKDLPDIEVIVVTAFGEMDVAIKALQLDASDFITKPINHEGLHTALHRARARYQSRRQLKDHAALLEKENVRTAQELMSVISLQRDLIESSMDGILCCDADQRVIIFNRSIEHMLAYNRRDVVNLMTLDRFFRPDDLSRFHAAMASPQHGGTNRLFLYETFLLSQDQQPIPVQISATTLVSGEHQNGLVCFFRDRREIHRLEREVADQARILHQDKMMSLGRLAASVVHEINNPLSGILNYLRLMLRILKRGPLDQDHQTKFQRYLELVENETDRCSQIISNLLTFSRKSKLSFEPIDFTDLLKRSLVLSQHKLKLSNITASHVVEQALPPVRGDFNQLQQCIINLIFNAIDAMPQGGSLHLSARADSGTGGVIIAVRDAGIGISKENLPHIFEPFFTTKNEGSGVGLGLSTVYGIMEHHHGAVTVQSEPGHGTTFFLKLPTSTTVLPAAAIRTESDT
jgi:two-component system NtrC family sensor kinase